jgi:hypothetical protein
MGNTWCGKPSETERGVDQTRGWFPIHGIDRKISRARLCSLTQQSSCPPPSGLIARDLKLSLSGGRTRGALTSASGQPDRLSRVQFAIRTCARLAGSPPAKALDQQKVRAKRDFGQALRSAYTWEPHPEAIALLGLPRHAGWPPGVTRIDVHPRGANDASRRRGET